MAPHPNTRCGLQQTRAASLSPPEHCDTCHYTFSAEHPSDAGAPWRTDERSADPEAESGGAQVQVLALNTRGNTAPPHTKPVPARRLLGRPRSPRVPSAGPWGLPRQLCPTRVPRPTAVTRMCPSSPGADMLGPAGLQLLLTPGTTQSHKLRVCSSGNSPQPDLSDSSGTGRRARPGRGMS